MSQNGRLWDGLLKPIKDFIASYLSGEEPRLQTQKVTREKSHGDCNYFLLPAFPFSERATASRARLLNYLINVLYTR